MSCEHLASFAYFDVVSFPWKGSSRLRDILPLVERGILVRNPEGGRSTSYALAPPETPGGPG